MTKSSAKAGTSARAGRTPKCSRWRRRANARAARPPTSRWSPARIPAAPAPCADALIAAGVARVVGAMRDPFPQVDGSGFAKLRAAGIVVEIGLMEAQARALNRGFLSRIERGRPWLRVKLATQPRRPQRAGLGRFEMDQRRSRRDATCSAGARVPARSSPAPAPC